MTKSKIKIALIIITLAITAAVLPALAGDTYAGFAIGNAKDDVLDESASAWKVNIGKDINKYYGFDFAWAEFGDYVFGFLQQRALMFHMVGTLPVAGGFGIHAKAGLALWAVTADGFEPENGVDPSFGLGLHYYHKKFGVRVEFERVQNVLESDVDMASAGILYRW